MPTYLFFLCRYSFLMPRYCLSKLSCSIKSVPFCWQNFLNLSLVSFRILKRFALSFLKKISEKTSLVDGGNLLRFLRIFLNEFSEMNCLVKSFVRACTINILGLLSNRTSISSFIFSLVAPGKFLIFTRWFFNDLLVLIL